MIRKRHETGTERPSLSHDETLRKIMDDAAREYLASREYRTSREYKTKCVRAGAYVVGGLVVLAFATKGTLSLHNQHVSKIKAAHDRLQAKAIVELLETPDALQALNLTSAELRAVAQQEATNAKNASGSMRDGYNSLAWLLKNAATQAETIQRPNLTPASYEQVVGSHVISLTALDVLAPPLPVIADIGRLETETPISAR